MFTDETVEIAGPIRSGPSLCEWAGVEPGLLPSRRLQNAYLSWCRLVRADGETHPRRIALGAWAGRGFAITGFTRPRTNALSFRLADALARDVLDACRA